MDLADGSTAQAYFSPGSAGVGVTLGLSGVATIRSEPASADSLRGEELRTAALHVRTSCLRLLQTGEEIAPRDLLAVVLGCCMPVGRAVALAESLMQRFGSLGGVVACSPTRLRKSLGGEEVALILLKALYYGARHILREPIEDRPLISSSKALRDYLSATMRHESRESARILFLDRKNGLIRDEILGQGTVDHVPLYPREIVQRVLELDAAAVILVHNHPSGDPTPSSADIDATRELVVALKSIRVSLHDHIVVGRNRELSFRASGLLTD